MDPNNPVVKRCIEGNRAEFEGRIDDARALFWQAWEASEDDYNACIAAHYVARHQKSPEDTLRWNLEALARADAVGDDRIQNMLLLLLFWAFGRPILFLLIIILLVAFPIIGYLLGKRQSKAEQSL